MTPALAIDPPAAITSENMLHAVAHEIRQPLSAIESIAYYVSMVLPGDDPKHRDQLARIQQLVEQSNWILSNGLGLADTRHPSPQTLDLGELIAQAISSRPPSLDPRVHCEFASNLPLVHLDPGFGRALVENLLGLFRQLATAAHPVQLRILAAPDGVELEVFTSMPGYRSIASLPPGSALSLDFAQRIAAMHGGACSSSIDPITGIRVRVVLP